MSYPEGDPQEYLLFWYFQKERQIRFKETLLLMAASMNNGGLVTKLLREYEADLFPEMKGIKQDFVNDGKETMKQYKGKAFKLSTTGDKASASLINEDDVGKVFEDQQKALEDVREEMRERWKKKFGKVPKELQ